MTTASDPNANARRNALILSGAQAFGSAVPPIAISMGGLVGLALLGEDKSFATLPVTSYNIGVALGALPAAMVMAAIGRRFGFMGGMGVGICGTLLASFAIVQGSFWLFACAMAFIGIGGSFAQQFRFAAADQGTKEFKPKAISWVLAGGVFAAIIGTQTANTFRDLFAPVDFAGAFFAGAFLLVIAIIILSFLRFEKPLSRAERNAADTGRALSAIITQPRFMVSVLCAVGSYALMSYVMTGAPLAMKGHGHSITESTNGIMLHVIAMFAPSFFTGNLIARFGKERIVAIGLTILIACAAVALMGVSLMHYYSALILLGLGWNFGFIGATAMLTDTYEPEEKAKAQGANDFILFGMVAFGSFMSGTTLNAFGAEGWQAINWVVFPVALVCLAGLGWLAFVEKRSGAVS